MGEESSEKENVLKNLELQLQEVGMLQAMFPGDKEIIWHDPTLLLDAEQYMYTNGKTCNTLRCLNFDINLNMTFENENIVGKCDLKVSIILSKSYPRVHPDVSVISNDLSRTSQSTLNQDLKNYIYKLEFGEMVLLDVIGWLQENTVQYVNKCSCVTESTKEDNEDSLSYMWLYMHHIYNKNKRKDIINWANELTLTGFSLPGKPGVVYIEGSTDNVEVYYDRLRHLNWKRLTCKLKEFCGKRIFFDFQELCFDVHGGRDYHMDMGKFYMFLKENNLGSMFKVLFGVDGHETK